MLRYLVASLQTIAPECGRTAMALLGWGLARTTPRRDRMYHAAITVTPSETTLTSRTNKWLTADTDR